MLVIVGTKISDSLAEVLLVLVSCCKSQLSTGAWCQKVLLIFSRLKFLILLGPIVFDERCSDLW